MFETQNDIGMCVAGNWFRMTVLAVPTLKLKNIRKENVSAHRVVGRVFGLLFEARDI
jgi:hypothetical protein